MCKRLWKPWVEQGLYSNASGSYALVTYIKCISNYTRCQATLVCKGSFAPHRYSEMQVLDYSDNTGTHIAYRYSNGSNCAPTSLHLSSYTPY